MPSEGSLGGLGELLRSRRERLCPADVGLPARARRRTPGLRREEVAQLANVSTTYYTFLEQGRATRPSPEVVDALAAALRLDPVEQRHLRDLAYAVAQHHADEPETLAEPVRRLVRRLDPHPTYVKGRRWDILAANASAVALFGGWDGNEHQTPNMLRWMFTDPAARDLYTDWSTEARGMLARFRAATAARPNDPAAHALLEEIRGVSTEARSWWQRHHVAPIGSGDKTLRHKIVGELRLEHAVLHVGGQPDQHLVTFSGLERDESDRFEHLHHLATTIGC
jgi:transcriptional regulator with XRE-family HTH domain